MSDHLHSVRVFVMNAAKFPLAELSIMHWQEAGNHRAPVLLSYSFNDKTNTTFTAAKTNFKEVPSSIIFNDAFAYESNHDSYWAICWRNLHDPVLYYLVSTLSYWQKLERDVIKGLDDAIGDAIDVITESDAGTVGAFAANMMVQKMYEAKDGNIKIQCKINTDTNAGGGVNIFSVFLPCGRNNYKVESGNNHKTNCSAQTYTPGTGDSCHGSPAVQ